METNQHEHTRDPLGNEVYRFIATLDSGKEIVTWASNIEAAKEKVLRTRGSLKSIRPAGNPLEDRPNAGKPYKGPPAHAEGMTDHPKECYCDLCNILGNVNDMV
jgi:hypothetical protein